MPAICIGFYFDDPRLLKHLEMLRSLRLADLQSFRDLSHAQRPASQQRDHPHSARFGQSGKYSDVFLVHIVSAQPCNPAAFLLSHPLSLRKITSFRVLPCDTSTITDSNIPVKEYSKKKKSGIRKSLRCNIAGLLLKDEYEDVAHKRIK